MQWPRDPKFEGFGFISFIIRHLHNSPVDFCRSFPTKSLQWWGPDGFTTTTSVFEFKPGGQWRFVMHGPDGRDYQNRVIYVDIVPPERLVYRHTGDEDVEPVQFIQELTFEDLGGGKTRLTWSGTFPSAEQRAHVIKDYGADKGLVQCLARLAEFVAQQGGVAVR